MAVTLTGISLVASAAATPFPLTKIGGVPASEAQQSLPNGSKTGRIPWPGTDGVRLHNIGGQIRAISVKFARNVPFGQALKSVGLTVTAAKSQPAWGHLEKHYTNVKGIPKGWALNYGPDDNGFQPPHGRRPKRPVTKTIAVLEQSGYHTFGRKSVLRDSVTRTNNDY